MGETLNNALIQSNKAQLPIRGWVITLILKRTAVL
ncbi:MAG: hypothetical protein RL214_101 [Pseudomonadota bacterium]|jgi:hypothetical protein